MISGAAIRNWAWKNLESVKILKLTVKIRI
jgi:hypothetical protein